MPHPMPNDPEILDFIARTEAFYPPEATDWPMEKNRAYYDRFAEVMRGPEPENVAWHDVTLDGPPPLALRLYKASKPRAATLLYLHGGGFVLGGLESHHDACLGFCALTGLDTIAVAYRLAPEHPHPAQLEDCDAAFRFALTRNQPIVIAGDSAGGNLTAALCLRYRTRPEARRIAGQVLIYPGLGGDPDQGSYLENAEAPMLTRADCLAYAAFRGGYDHNGRSKDPELAPLSAADLRGLPPAYCVSADIDPLRDDARDYAARLKQAGITATWKNEPQLVHGYLRARHSSQRAAASFADIATAMIELSGV